MKRWFLVGLVTGLTPAVCKPPKMTIVIIIDQFAAYHIPKVYPYLSGGIKFLADNGTSYLNAYFEHNAPGTGPGHTLLATGTYGTYHGIVNNYWYDKKGKKVTCDGDTAERAAVFAPNGLYPFGKSANNIRVDTLSDQLMLHSYPHAKNSAWALSLKSRAAIATAGRLGKAVWFDGRSGNFTSSKAYFPELPNWIRCFNEQHTLSHQSHVFWQPFFLPTSSAYAFKHVGNYCYSILKDPLFNRVIPLFFSDTKRTLFDKTPQANQLLIDLAVDCISTHYHDQEKFVLWLSLSTFDKTGHIYGPHSYEMIDLMYHIDHQLKEFMDKVYQRVPEEDVLFVLTGDHGVQPIPEIVQKEGLTLARRLLYPEIIDNLNKIIEQEFCIEGLVQHFKEPQFYLNQELLSQITNEKKEKIYATIKEYLATIPGIRKVWSFEELENKVFQPYNLDRYLQRQLYKGRSGQIIYGVAPYTTLDDYEPEGRLGTAHVTGFAFDTHVPLIFYQKNNFEKKNILKNVSMTQLSVSLATLLGVPRPSASTADILPEFHL